MPGNESSLFPGIIVLPLSQNQELINDL